MLEQMKRAGVILFLASLSFSVYADTGEVKDTSAGIKDTEIPTLNPDEGRIGEIRRVTDETEFKVCTDPDNMPYSDVRQEGFEDKIAALLAKDLGKKLSFAYAYNRQGFLRNTINANRCDVIMGTSSDYDALRTSTPYYRSGYVFVWRKDSNYNITDWDSPDLKKGIIGIVDKSPATVPLNDHNLMANARPYRLQRDLNLPPSFIIDDLVKGDIDVAIVWGPIGGYYAKRSKVPLEVRLIPDYNEVNIRGKEFWNISVGVRKKDKERIKMINEALERNKDKIADILAEYGIPTVPVVEGDNVFKK
jgi:mxaJ protein